MYLWGVKQLGGLHQWFFSFVKQWHHFKHAGCFYSFPFQMFCTKRTHAILQYHATVFSLKAFSIGSDFNPFLQTFDKKTANLRAQPLRPQIMALRADFGCPHLSVFDEAIGRSFIPRNSRTDQDTVRYMCIDFLQTTQLNHIVNDDALVRDRVRGFAASTSIGAPPYHM